MKKDTLIFIGRSGSGKGTQIDLLKKYLKENFKETDILHFESGSHLRSFVDSSGYTNELIHEIISDGSLAPDFITEWLFVKELVNSLTPLKMLIIDGFPRTKNQAKTLFSVMEYYKRDDVKIIHINVGESEVRRRIEGRSRIDDKKKEIINKRMKWYSENVLPTLEYLENKEHASVFHINGELSIDNVHKLILQNLKY